MAVSIDDFNWDMDDAQISDTPPTEDVSDKPVENTNTTDDTFEFEPLPSGADVDSKDDANGTVSDDMKWLNSLKEREVLTIDFTEEDDAETIFNRQLEQDVNDAITEIFADVKQQPEAVALIKHLRDGGSVSNFIANSSYAISTEIETEAQQEAVIKDYYTKRKGMDSEEVSDLIDALKNNGKLEGRAENVKVLIEKERAKEVADRELAKKESDKQLIEQHKKMTSNLTGIVRDTKFDFKGIGKDKDDTTLVDFLTKPVDSNGRTLFQKEVSNLFVEKNHEKLLILAKLIKTDFNFDKLIKKGATQQVRTIKDKVENRSVHVATGNSRNSKSLADFFD